MTAMRHEAISEMLDAQTLCMVEMLAETCIQAAKEVVENLNEFGSGKAKKEPTTSLTFSKQAALIIPEVYLPFMVPSQPLLS